jgi:hypothetical protein
VDDATTDGDEECKKVVADDRDEDAEVCVRNECGRAVQKQRSSELEVWTQCFAGLVVFHNPERSSSAMSQGRQQQYPITVRPPRALCRDLAESE